MNEDSPSGGQKRGLSNMDNFDLNYREKPPSFPFEHKLAVVRDVSNMSGIEQMHDDEASSTATPLEIQFGDRSWSWLSANSGKNGQHGSPALTARNPPSKLPPPDLSRLDGKPSMNNDRNGEDLTVDKFAGQVPSEIWAQMKRLEALQDPFNESNQSPMIQPQRMDPTMLRLSAAMKKLEALQNPLEEKQATRGSGALDLNSTLEEHKRTQMNAHRKPNKNGSNPQQDGCLLM